MLLCSEDIFKGFIRKLLCSWGNPFSGVLWGGFWFVQLEFRTAFATDCLFLLEAIPGGKYQTECVGLVTTHEILFNLAA